MRQLFTNTQLMAMEHHQERCFSLETAAPKIVAKVPHHEVVESLPCKKVTRRSSVREFTQHILPVEESTLLRDILDLSDSLILSTNKETDEDEVLTKLTGDDWQLYFTPIKSKQESLPREGDSELTDLDDPPITCSGCQLPVAADLLNDADLFPHNNGNRKRSREESSEEDESESDVHGIWDEDGLEDQWAERFRELCEYKEQVGHCSVPHNFKYNPRLARWVKRQRNQYKQYKNAESIRPESSKERYDALNSIGFVWDCRGVAWNEMFEELLEYRATFLDCKVPTSYPPNPQLAMWVKGQRRQYKLYRDGMKSSMTRERAQQLERIGFTWELRKHKRFC